MIEQVERLKKSAGVYLILMELPRDGFLRVGKLGSTTFPKGFYAYIGSALGKTSTSLGWRLNRYLNINTRRRRWHIDYILGEEGQAEIRAIFFAETGERKECTLSKTIASKEWAEVPLKGLGSSDCAEGCPAHFYKCNINRFADLKTSIRRAFEENTLIPKELDVPLNREE